MVQVLPSRAGCGRIFGALLYLALPHATSPRAPWPGSAAERGVRAEGQGPLRHTVMPSVKGPLQTSGEGSAGPGLPAFPLSRTCALRRVQWCRGAVGTLVGLVVRMMFIHHSGEAFGGSISLAELCMEDMGPQKSYRTVPRGTDSSKSSPFLLPRAIKALFSTTMTQGNLHPLLKCPFQGRWDNTKSTPLKPPDPQPHRRAGLHPSFISCGHTGGWRTGRSPGHGAASAASQEAPGPAGSVPRPSVPPWGPWLALGARDLAPRWSREPLGTAATASPMVAWEPRRRERRGPGDKVPFQPEPWKDVCVCVCVCRG